MPIELADAPAELADLVTARLRSLPQPIGLEPGGEEALHIYRPLPVYSIDIDALAHLDGHADRLAEHRGWWILVGEGMDMTIVDAPIHGEQLNVGLVLRGRLGEQLADASVVAERELADGVQREARILDLREIGLIALWLHAEERNGFIVPLWEEEQTLQSFDETMTVGRQRARFSLGLG